MPRYFLEVSYKGTNYRGFQVQRNADSVQGEIEKVFQIILRQQVSMTGSSRTDAGVHAIQNFFHFDLPAPVQSVKGIADEQQLRYKMNAILPADIAVKNLFIVKADANCRFDAIRREYSYYIYSHKNPFLTDRAFFYPYKLNIEKMNAAAAVVLQHQDFTSFSKRNTQVRNFICHIEESNWIAENGFLIYTVKANRFLRGMVRGLTATMLKVGRGGVSLDDFQSIIEVRDCSMANFSVPPHGLFLKAVNYPENYFS